jgi:AraC family transcriptional regulator
MTSPIHSVHFHVPQAQLDAIAGDAGIRVGSQLAFTPGAAIDDPVLRGLASLLLPAFQRPAEANRLFVETIRSQPAPTSRGPMEAWMLRLVAGREV